MFGCQYYFGKKEVNIRLFFFQKGFVRYFQGYYLNWKSIEAEMQLVFDHDVIWYGRYDTIMVWFIMNHFSVDYIEHILRYSNNILQLKKQLLFLLLKHIFIYTFKSVWLNVHLLKSTSKPDKVFKSCRPPIWNFKLYYSFLSLTPLLFAITV